MSNSPTWVKSHPDRWLNGEVRLSMSLAERGAYRDLFDHAVVNGSIPSDQAILARILGVDASEFETIWPRVSKEFKEGKDGRLTNDKATRVRNEARRFMKKQADNGSKGGRPKKNPTETQSKPMGLPTANPRQRHGVTHTKHKQTNKQTIVGRKQTERQNRQEAAEEDGVSVQSREASDAKREPTSDQRRDNGLYRPTIDDAKDLCSLMFKTTQKKDSVETARRWLQSASRARDYREIRQYLSDRIRECKPENKPRSNAWFQTTIRNGFSLSPEDTEALEGEYRRRYREAARGNDNNKRQSEMQLILEQAQAAGIPPGRLINSI